MTMLRLTKITGLPVWVRASRIVAVVPAGSTMDAATEVVIDAVPAPLKILVVESVDHVGELVIATELQGDYERCDISASTLGELRECMYPKGHAGAHTWEEGFSG